MPLKTKCELSIPKRQSQIRIDNHGVVRLMRLQLKLDYFYCRLDFQTFLESSYHLFWLGGRYFFILDIYLLFMFIIKSFPSTV